MTSLHAFPDLGPLLLLLLTYAAAATFSGLAGFGLSAIGSLSLLQLSPQVGIPLLMVLSLATQLSNLGALWPELRGHVVATPQGVGAAPFIVGGLVGVPAGLLMLQHVDTRNLLLTLGSALMLYATWALLRSPTISTRPDPTRLHSALLVGAAGGVAGGFAAFPGIALVIWNGMTGASKERSRARVQPFILVMQSAALALFCWMHPQPFTAQFCMLLLLALPAALIGSHLGTRLYRRTGYVGFRRITTVVLGLAGATLVARAFA
jgi:uncharacterized membrane protein YfcA